ncbi:MAG TPA: cobalamin-dependent protein [Ktedonobacteraceae bacterium]|nr:cobalamin-dependent protein [Ktedonobacteraceae bacterium]
MRVKMILPALTEAISPYFRPIKYSLFPPLGLATLAGYLQEDDQVIIQDEHVEKLDLNDNPDLVVIQVYITSAYRAYELADHYRARGAYVALGGLHVTSLPDEAAPHADSLFLGPGEDIWPAFLRDYRQGCAAKVYTSQVRTLSGVPRIRRDLIKRHLYLVPNSIVVSRGCPHVCDFCYKEAFYKGGKSFYTLQVDDALAEINRLPGRHLYRDFYRWSSIFQGAWTKERWNDRLRHIAYAAGWKKFEPAWDLIIKAKQASSMLPVLETILASFGRRTPHE